MAESVVAESGPATQPAVSSLAWVEEIERAFRERDPGAFFVLPRIMRRILRSELDITSPWVRLPHRKTLVIERDRLLWLVALDELGAEHTVPLPQRVVLVARPEDDRLQRLSPAELERTYWRLLLHARIDETLLAAIETERLTTAHVRQQIDRIGQASYDEVRSVLRHEGMLMHPDDARRVYAEFVAVFHELRLFVPDLLPLYFPSLGTADEIRRILLDDLDADKLLEDVRPQRLAGVDPAVPVRPQAVNTDRAEVDDEAVAAAPSAWRYKALVKAAETLRARGNSVRAALLRQRALACTPVESREEAAEAVTQEMRTLAERLQAALELDDDDAAAWQAMCLRLLPAATRGFWNANARLLYDLQKVCLDHERETYHVSLWGWIKSRGAQPLRQPLPHLRVVLIAKHLRSAARRIAAVRIDREGRDELNALLHHAALQAEAILRTRMQPVLSESLVAVGVQPADVVDRVAFRRLTAELLDVIVDRGFLTLGHVRDAFSRSPLKLPDIVEIREFVAGDLLLRTDGAFAASLPGVYQRGPFYLRWLQRITSLAFGTPTGRFFTLYAALPFGGAFVILKGLHYLVEEVAHFLPHGPEPDPAHHTPTAAEQVVHEVDVAIYSHEAMVILGCVLFVLIHGSAFRQAAVAALRGLWSTGRLLFYEMPRAVMKYPLVASLFRSVPVLLFRRYLLSPLLVTLVAWLVVPLFGLYTRPSLWGAVGILGVTAIALNSRFGRDSEELLWEFLEKSWHRIRVHLIIGLFNLIVDVFRQVMDALDRVLYSVDEWLRFRSGESSLSLVVKAVLAPIWGLINAVIRFAVTLLIEPQLNPIKHFPVVTVSHKLILPSLPYITAILATFFDRYTAGLLGFSIVTSIPGIFGFLAWEFKENWRLYAANRPVRLLPVRFGHHGESLLLLLRPGFHSGTIPKLFAKRRRAARKSRLLTDVSRQAKFEEKLHHEAEAVERFVDRELIVLLRESQRFHNRPLKITSVDLATNRIRVSIVDEQSPDDPCELAFSEQSGWLVAGIARAGWAKHLNADERYVLSAALAGLYQFGDVHLVREQMERKLATPHGYDIGESGLIVWPTKTFDAEVTYSLQDRPLLTPRPRAVARSVGLEPLPAAALIFTEHPITWARWREFWTAESVDPICPGPLLRDVALLRE